MHYMLAYDNVGWLYAYLVGRQRRVVGKSESKWSSIIT
jgi:hypothetical protein